MIEPELSVLGGESFVQRIHITLRRQRAPSKLRLVRARLVLSEYLTFSLQGVLATRRAAHAALD